MSLTPIYDELRELPITGNAGDTSGGTRRSSRRLSASASGGANVGQLAGRGGLGGKHRRPAE